MLVRVKGVDVLRILETDATPFFISPSVPPSCTAYLVIGIGI